jgi:hypothetical protein
VINWQASGPAYRRAAGDATLPRDTSEEAPEDPAAYPAGRVPGTATLPRRP